MKFRAWEILLQEFEDFLNSAVILEFLLFLLSFNETVD